MTAYALRLANGQDTAARVRFGDALGLTPGDVPLAARSGLRPDGGGVVSVSAGTMDVTVTPFAAWIDGGTSDAQAGYPFFLDATATLTLAAGDATQARVDTIVAEVQDDAYDGSTFTQATLHVVQGTPGGGAPALPVTCIPLRDVNVPAGVSLGTGGLSGSNLGADRRTYVAGLGGILPVASQPERDALNVQPGAAVYRADTDAVEVKRAGGWSELAVPGGVNFTTYLAANQTIANATWSAITAFTEVMDTASALSAGTFTAPVAGLYLFTVNVFWQSNPTGARYCSLWKAAPTGVFGEVPGSGTLAPSGLEPRQSTSALLHLNAGDQVQARVYHTAGSPIGVIGATDYGADNACRFAGTLLVAD